MISYKKKDKKKGGCERTLSVIRNLSTDQIYLLLQKYGRPDMMSACDKKFGFQLCKQTMIQRLQDEEAVYKILLDDEEVDIMKNSAPEWIHMETYEMARKLDDNQFDALIERYCRDKIAKRQAKKYFGFELDDKTLKWLKENKPIYEFLE